MSKMDKLKEIIRELIKKELAEASTSGATPGYDTPNASLTKALRGSYAPITRTVQSQCAGRRRKTKKRRRKRRTRHTRRRRR